MKRGFNRHCNYCGTKLIRKDKRKAHRNWGRIICLFCAGMWEHDRNCCS